MKNDLSMQQRRERCELLMRLPVQELADALRGETEKFLQQQDSDGCFGLALFALAIERQNQDAWVFLYRQYAPLVLAWVVQYQSAAPLLALDGNSHSFVNAAFAKFISAVCPAKLAHFESLGSVLKYLKTCVQSVMADEMYSRRAYACEDTWEAVEEPVADDLVDGVIAELSAQSIWQVIQEELSGDDERVLMYLALVQEWKPGEMSQKHRALFPTVHDVYRVKRNVLERLKRNRARRRFMHEDAA